MNENNKLKITLAYLLYSYRITPKGFDPKTILTKRKLSSNMQQNIYIPSGDQRSESYRLATFQKFPKEQPRRNDLSAAGFYYIGILDITICFSCGFKMRNWPPDAKPSDARYHNAFCLMMRGGDPNNKPIIRYFRLEIFQESFKQSSNDTRMKEIDENNNCLLQQQTGASGEARVCNNKEMLYANNFLKTQLIITYPCNNPQNPHMKRLQMRLETFEFGWERKSLMATPEEIAKAGLFFLGDSDRTKCWYCNGGLQNWEPNDDPMYEHAKWFPGCEFALQSIGPAKVCEIYEKFANIPRPNIINAVDYKTGLHLLKNFTIESDELQRFMRSNIVEEVLKMQFTVEQIEQKVLTKWQNFKRLFETSEELVNELLNQENDVPQLRRHPEEDDKEESTQSTDEDKFCRGCKTNLSNVVNMPCGHLCECTNCPSNKCRICKRNVVEKIKCYLP